MVENKSDLGIYYKGNSVLFKYIDNTSIVSPVYNNVDPSSILVNLFLRWSNENEMSCNTYKCKELIV